MYSDITLASFTMDPPFPMWWLSRNLGISTQKFPDSKMKKWLYVSAIFHILFSLHMQHTHINEKLELKELKGMFRGSYQMEIFCVSLTCKAIVAITIYS